MGLSLAPKLQSYVPDKIIQLFGLHHMSQEKSLEHFTYYYRHKIYIKFSCVLAKCCFASVY